MSVNLPERDLDPEELELEQEDAFGMSNVLAVMVWQSTAELTLQTLHQKHHQHKRQL